MHGRWRGRSRVDAPPPATQHDEAATLERCNGCRAPSSIDVPLTLDSSDKQLYCVTCWTAYYGRSPSSPVDAPTRATVINGREDGKEFGSSGYNGGRDGIAGRRAAPNKRQERRRQEDRKKNGSEACVDEGFWEELISAPKDAPAEKLTSEELAGENAPALAEVPAEKVAALEKEDVVVAEENPCISPVYADNSAASDAPTTDSRHAVAVARFAAEISKLRQGESSGGSSFATEQQQAEEMEALSAIYGDALVEAPVLGENDASCTALRTLRLEFAIEVRGSVELWVETPDGSVCAGVVETLPPMALYCALPSSYPDNGKPVSVVFAEHLNAVEVSEVEEELRQIASERDGECFLFEWASLLQERAAVPPTKLVLGRDDDGMTTALQLLSSDRQTLEARRQRELQQCPVCFDEVLGSRGIFLTCGHFGCRDCLGSMTRIHTGEADITALRCPVTDCREPFSLDALRDLLGEDSPLLARWEALSLQHCLDKMQDVAYCPRCDMEGTGVRIPCIQDEDGTAVCDRCSYAFCARCRDAYHPGVPCASPDERMQALEVRAAGTGPEAKIAQTELMTLRQLARTTKACPSCGTAIEKSEGCSKMHCRNCGAYFCWRCGKTIQGYDHFATGACKLFDDEEIRRWNQRPANPILRAEARAHEARFLAQFVDPATMWEQMRQCPRCKAGVVREGRNNHLRCYACQTQFCAKCGVLLPKKNPGGHFKVGGDGCPQHSD